ncbi:MAG: 30S ribosomal protein S9 [Candidatus Omnitrophica bacterium]|nr:30S ribosomal protein S9 [Candidatus Omnitrophota bacterium]
MAEENIQENVEEIKQDKQQDVIWATGRRKRSIARVRLILGNGEMKVNGKPLDEYFDRPTSRLVIRQPFNTTNLLGKYDVIATVNGGGKSGQAGALRHGISRALALTGQEIKTALKRKGFLTRDPRKKERKKPGQKGARKKFQWTKR